MCLFLSPISNHHFHKAGQGNSNFGWWILVQTNSPKFVFESSFQFLPLSLMYGSMRRLLKPNSPWKPPRLLEGRCSILRRLSRSEEEESPSAPSGFMMGDTHCPGPVTSGQGAEDYLARAGLGKWGGQLGLGVSSLAMYCEPTNWKLYHFHSQSSSVTELAFHLKLVQSTGIGFGANVRTLFIAISVIWCPILLLFSCLSVKSHHTLFQNQVSSILFLRTESHWNLWKSP